MSQYYTATDHFVLLPAILLALFGCATLLFDFLIFPEAKQRRWLLVFLVLGEVFAGVAFWRQQAFLLEHGGEAARRTKTKTRRLRYRPRPFMGPAFEAEKPQLPALWKNSVR